MTGISAGELVIDPAGKSSYSGRFTGVDGCIQNGPPSAVEIERTGQALKITLTSRREAGWKPVVAGEKDDDTDHGGKRRSSKRNKRRGKHRHHQSGNGSQD